MYRIRFHGRGGQGIKTASRMLGSAMFHAGFIIQDAPRYGAERRGAPIFAYVRASHDAINERGIIKHPDLVLVTDDSLIAIPSAGVTEGIRGNTVLLIVSNLPAAEWKSRLNTPATVLCVSPPAADSAVKERLLGARCVGAAAKLLGVIDKSALDQGIRDEIGGFDAALVNENIQVAIAAFEELDRVNVRVCEGRPLAVEDYRETHWTDLAMELQAQSAPAIHRENTSIEVRTGLWRTLRPVIDYDLCNRCNWVCSNFCPDSAITVRDDGYPEIDLDHCKGCLICVAQCPPHAILTVPESEAQRKEVA
ncbi:MAG TPA: 2-oxoacid:acceptor oxidoreductase family protein [Pseudomonadales bacterium]|nr:2-oxoacid:acceptor oxidoreductase family protein [Pseudomonadales bacterium]